MTDQATSWYNEGASANYSRETSWPSGDPAPFPAGAWTIACMVKCDPDMFDSGRPTYQCLFMANAYSAGGFANIELLAINVSGTVNIWLGGYDQIPNEEYEIITGADRTSKFYAVFSWDGTNTIKFRWRFPDQAWNEQSYASSNADGTLERIFNGYTPEQSIMNTASIGCWSGELSNAQLDSIIALGGEVPTGGLAPNRFYKQVAYTTRNIDDSGNDYDAEPDGVSTGSTSTYTFYPFDTPPSGNDTLFRMHIPGF